MKIENLFSKKINRPISGVIKIGNGEENRHQELEEYVVTKELNKYFAQFFDAFSQTNESSQKEIGVWISGFYGSGKSHFMKILSYIIDNEKIDGKRPVDYFIDGNKIEDPIVIANMEKSAEMSTDVILFDIESMSADKENSKEAVLNTFLRMFNDKLGYDNMHPSIAEFERQCDEDGMYEAFKAKYKEVSGNDWVDDRKKIKVRRKKFVEAVTSLDIMAEEDANKTIDNVYSPYNISVSDFAQIVNEYCVNKGPNHRVVFLADEMGQYVADNTSLLLNLQTISEDFSTYCKGKAWIIVTSQQNIDDITHVSGEDFSKIQARFNMRLSLSSSDVSEVIQKRILDKTEAAKEALIAYYEGKEAIIKNLIDFSSETVFKRKYANSEDFANCYPFIPYQFDLLGNVLTQIRKNSSSGKHLADGNRSMLALVQESAVSIKDSEIGAIVPFNRFYDCLEKWIDHQYRNVIDGAARNEKLEAFDVEILKVLFMIKHVKEIQADIKNITTLMVDNVDADRVDLTNKVSEGLKRLIDQTLVQKNGDYYTFLTDAEQELELAVKREPVSSNEIVGEIKNIIFGELYKDSKYQYKTKVSTTRYNFAFNQRVDETPYVQGNPIGLVIITPYNEKNYTTTQMRQLTTLENVAVINLPNEIEFQGDVKSYIQLKKYLTKNAGNTDSAFRNIKFAKQDELAKIKARVKLFIEQALKDAEIFINGSEVNIPTKEVKERINEALKLLVENVYLKLSYMATAPELDDLKKIFTSPQSIQLDGMAYSDNQNALDEVESYVKDKHDQAVDVNYKAILDRFSGNPYGWVNFDIHWLVLKLYKQKKIEFKMNGSLVLESDMSVDSIVKLVTSSTNHDKLIVRIKPTISPRQIKSVNDICKDFDSSFVKMDDNDLLFNKAKEVIKTKLDDLYRYEVRFNGNPALPGKQYLLKLKQCCVEMRDKRDPNEFYQYCDNKYDNIRNAFDDFMVVESFFNGVQIGIFEKAQKNLQSIDANQNFINEQRIFEIGREMESIITSLTPFNKMPQLSMLNNEYEGIVDKLLSETKTRLQASIETHRCRTENELGDNQELVDLFSDDIKHKFDILQTKLTNTTTLLDANHVDTEARQVQYNLSQQINAKKLQLAQQINEGDDDGDNPIPVVNVKTVYVKDLFAGSNKAINSKQDLNELLNNLKDKLEKELDNGNIINIKIQ